MTRSCLAAAAAVLILAAPAGGATVREPAFGLPHFYAATDVELARENGREIARDRLGQLILLARVGRGTLAQVFGLLDPSTLDDDILARQSAYTSRELNGMFAKLPAAERAILLAYCEGVNDTIDDVYAGRSPEPLEVNVLRALGFGVDLFGNATDISDQLDPYYRAPGGADPQRPAGGFQFTPEMAVAIAILEVRNFGLESFDEPSRLAELQALMARHSATAGTQIWDDLNFLNDPLAPVTVPDPTTPGYGGPLARRPDGDPTRTAAVAAAQPRFDYAAAAARRRAAGERRQAFAAAWGAWPKLGSYAWAIAGSRSASGHPWIGGFPQTGIQTPSIMHFAENRSGEGVQAVGMEFAGGPYILIGQTDSVAYTTTTALLRTVDTYFEAVLNEDADSLRYDAAGTPAPLLARVETFRFSPADVRRTMWRSHERGGTGGARPVIDFLGDTAGTASGGSATTLVAAGAFDAGFVGGHIAIVTGTAAGAIRRIAAVRGDDTVEVDAAAPWPFAPGADSEFVAVRPGNHIVAVATESPLWLEETTAVYGFSRYQRAQSILDVRAGARLIPSTHNFLAADNRPYNGVGANDGNGNIGYWATGFSRIRLDGSDVRTPIDGRGPSPFVVAAGTVGGATATTLSLPGAFAHLDLAPPPLNYRYANPSEQGREYIVSITSGVGYKQTRRIAGNDGDTLTLEHAWGVVPQEGDTFEVYAVVAMPEAVNPVEGYLANWNNKAATADDGNNFGRLWRHIFILERLAARSDWDRQRQRQLNNDVAGLDGKGDIGRFLLPRVRQAVTAAGGVSQDHLQLLTRLQAHQSDPDLGRYFNDPVADTLAAGEVEFLNRLVNALAVDIYGDEFAGAVPVPSGSRALSLVQHAIDSAAGDVPGAYQQAWSGDYFNGRGWQTVVRDTFIRLAADGIPADAPRRQDRYAHPLSALLPELVFPPVPQGNRGIWEQIVEVGPQVRGEFIFPLGQSGLITGSLQAVTSVDPHFTSLHPIWRDWRFVPMLPIAADLQAGGSADGDDDGVTDAFERWYFGSLERDGDDDGDHDGLTLAEEAQEGVDPTSADTDGDGLRDGFDTAVRDRLADSACWGDCGGDRAVTIDDLLVAVGISLETSPLDRCPLADRSGDGAVSIDEIIRAVNAALIDCAV